MRCVLWRWWVLASIIRINILTHWSGCDYFYWFVDWNGAHALNLRQIFHLLNLLRSSFNGWTVSWNLFAYFYVPVLVGILNDRIGTWLNIVSFFAISFIAAKQIKNENEQSKNKKRQKIAMKPSTRHQINDICSFIWHFKFQMPAPNTHLYIREIDNYYSSSFHIFGFRFAAA